MLHHHFRPPVRSLLRFVFRRQYAITNVLRRAVRIRPVAIPRLLLQSILQYPALLIASLILVKSYGCVIRLLLLRDSKENIQFRFGRGILSLNLDYFLVYLRLALRNIYCFNIKNKLIIPFEGIYIVVPSIEAAGSLNELPIYEKMYHVFDFRGKRVLDVGGFLGETACLFHKWGASWVEAYEPSEEHFKFVKINMILNKVTGIAHPFYINGGGYGQEWSCKSRNWNDLLRAEQFDIAKVDCEGCEEGLTMVDDALLRRVPLWVVECHSASTFKRVGQKFRNAGFEVTYRTYLNNAGYTLFGVKQWFDARVEVPDGLIIMVAELKTT